MRLHTLQQQIMLYRQPNLRRVGSKGGSVHDHSEQIAFDRIQNAYDAIRVVFVVTALFGDGFWIEQIRRFDFILLMIYRIF